MLLVRKPSTPPPFPPLHIFAPLLTRPWIMHACHSDASCHLGVTRTLHMLERFYWWIGMDISVRWWVRHCFKCQARKTSRLTVRWPVISLPLPNGPGQAVSVDYFGPLPVTPRGNSYILLFTDRFSRRADMYAVTAAEFTAEGTADIFINKYITLWGCPATLLSDNGLQFCSKLSQAVYRRLKVRKIATSSFHPNGNGGTERVNHTMAQMLSMVVNEQQNDWDVHLPHVSFAYNNSVSAATGLAPNEVHMGRLPRLPLTVFESSNFGGHQSLDRDITAYCDLAADRQRRSYDIVREQHAITVSRLARRHSTLTDALHKTPAYAAGGWVWVYNTAATIRQGATKDAGGGVLKSKLALNWTGPYKILAVGPCPAAASPDARPVGEKLLFLDLPLNMPGLDAKRRVSVVRCKPCSNPHDNTDMPRYLPAGLTEYVLNKYTTKSPPYHVTTEDVTPRIERLEVDRITAHRFVRGRGGLLAIMYETHWKDLHRPSWEREADLQRSRRHILLYWVGTPQQHRADNRAYRRLRIGAAHRELSRQRGERFLPAGYDYVSLARYRRHFSAFPLPSGAHFWYKSQDGLWWLGKIAKLLPPGDRYIVRFLDDPGPVHLTLSPSQYSTALDGVAASWCLQLHKGSAIAPGILRHA